MKNMRKGVPSLFKDGVRTLSGPEQVVVRNCEACKSLADITRTSFGPNGMNKMVVNYLGKLFVTSDTGTLLKEMEFDHPAAKIVVMAAHMQEVEIGDGGNFVVCVAGELLAKASELIYMGLMPCDIVSGYLKAAKKAHEILEELIIETVDPKSMFSKDVLARGIQSVIASKQYGHEKMLASLVAEACLTVIPKNTFNFNVDNVRVVKVLGGALQGSEVVHGAVVPHDTLGIIKKVSDARIAVFTCSIAAAEAETKSNVLIESAEELMNFNSGEEKHMEAMIRNLKESGINVIVTGGSVDDLADHYLDKYSIMCIKVTSKFDLRRLCKAVKARALVQMGPVRTEDVGMCAEVYVREVGSQKLTVFVQSDPDHTNIATILLRASTNNIMNDVERAIDDGVNVVKAMGRDGRFLPGAGAVEIELARRLQQFAQKHSGLDQYAINKFAEAMEIIPRTLAENSGQNAMDVVSALYAAHEKGEVRTGVDIDNSGVVADMTGAACVVDLYSAKVQALKLAVDAVATILRVDQIIVAKAAGGPKTGKKEGHWDDD